MFATLTVALRAIALVVRLVHNRTLRRIFNWAMWVYATLAALNLTDDVAGFFDGITISIGDLHISTLGILKPTLLIGIPLNLARVGTHVAERGLQSNDDITPSMNLNSAVGARKYSFKLLMLIQ